MAPQEQTWGDENVSVYYLDPLQFAVYGMRTGVYRDDSGLGRFWNLKANGLGDFSDDPYWSSNEADSNYSWYQDFSNGQMSRWAKSQETLKVRAVRGF
jgi:hypothetical protein